MEDNSEKFLVHVEACLKSNCTIDHKKIEVLVNEFLVSSKLNFMDKNVDFSSDVFLSKNLSYIHLDIDENKKTNGIVTFNQCIFEIYVFQYNEEGEGEEATEEEENLPAYSEWILPNSDFHGLWDSLIFEEGVKTNLLDYSFTAMLFSDKGVNTSLINWNRVILLHGPPGTGKTSLCKGLAQKMSIRLSHRYQNSVLVEINSHSLFSKWFSESGKLVMKLFGKIKELVEDENMFVCVLIDEVESLSAARKSALSGSEPSDSIRVVNALLTQIDSLKKYKNVLILTTSNITKAIDLAFVDRADLKLYIGNPRQEARYEIIRSCLLELCRVGIISPNEDFPNWNDPKAKTNEKSILLYEITENLQNVSGRFLRKLPFISHSSFIKKSRVTLMEYLKGLKLASEKELKEREKLE